MATVSTTVIMWGHQCNGIVLQTVDFQVQVSNHGYQLIKTIWKSIQRYLFKFTRLVTVRQITFYNKGTTEEPVFTIAYLHGFGQTTSERFVFVGFISLCHCRRAYILIYSQCIWLFDFFGCHEFDRWRCFGQLFHNKTGALYR